MYTEAIFKPQIWHNDNKLYFIINYKYNYYFYSYFVVLYSFEIKYKQAYPLLHKRVCEGLTHKPHSLIDLFWKLERVDCAKSKMSCTERMVRWGHRDAKALIEWLGYYDKAFELPLKTGGSTDRPRFGF